MAGRRAKRGWNSEMTKRAREQGERTTERHSDRKRERETEREKEKKREERRNGWKGRERRTDEDVSRWSGDKN